MYIFAKLLYLPLQAVFAVNHLSCFCISLFCLDPHQRKSMGLIWQIMAHIWPIHGTDMGRLDHYMELIWGPVL